MQSSSAEIAAAKNAERRDEQKRERLSKFVEGLENLQSLGLEEVDKTPSEEEYRRDAHAELRAILRKHA